MKTMSLHLNWSSISGRVGGSSMPAHRRWIVINLDTMTLVLPDEGRRSVEAARALAAALTTAANDLDRLLTESHTPVGAP